MSHTYPELSHKAIWSWTSIGIPQQGQMTKPTSLKHWRKPVGHWNRLQSHQNHSTVLQYELLATASRLITDWGSRCDKNPICWTYKLPRTSCNKSRLLHCAIVTRAAVLMFPLCREWRQRRVEAPSVSPRWRWRRTFFNIVYDFSD